jgi:hypothetical protein
MLSDNVRAYILAGVFLLATFGLLVAKPVASQFQAWFPPDTITVTVDQFNGWSHVSCEYAIKHTRYDGWEAVKVEPSCGKPIKYAR